MSSVPVRCFAIGDIHGHSKALASLLQLLTENEKMRDSDLLIFLGDYVDRGPDDLGVLEMVKTLSQNRPNTVALLGNHDSWRTSGTVPPEMALWLRQLPRYYRWKNYFFSHAPVYRFPNSELLDRLERRHSGEFSTFDEAVKLGYDFLNAFQGFSSEDLLKEEGVIGVCGHVYHHEKVVIFPEHYISVDSGAGFGGLLSAIVLPEISVISVTEAGVPV